MKHRGPSHADPTQKKTVQSVDQADCGKVWVNPKSNLKIICQQAWSNAEVPSPKFIDIGQIDLRTRTPPERPKAKAAAAGVKSHTSTKSPGGGG